MLNKLFCFGIDFLLIDFKEEKFVNDVRNEVLHGSEYIGKINNLIFYEKFN